MYKHLTRDDRAVIYAGLREQIAYAEIGRRIGKSTSAVSREIRRNSDENGTYDARRAQKRSWQRRFASKVGSRKIENDPVLGF